MRIDLALWVIIHDTLIIVCQREDMSQREVLCLALCSPFYAGLYICLLLCGNVYHE